MLSNRCYIMLFVALLLGLSCVANAQFQNDATCIIAAEGQQWDHCVAYNPERNEFLLTYYDFHSGQRRHISYVRLNAYGNVIGSEVTIPDDFTGTHRAAVCYNSANDEYMIAYTGWHDNAQGQYIDSKVYCQRVNANTGALIGGSIVMPGETSVAAGEVEIIYSSVNNSYMVVWQRLIPGNYDDIIAQRLNNLGQPSGTQQNLTAGQPTLCVNPQIAYNSVNDECMVLFQVDHSASSMWWDILGQRVRCSDGAQLGGNFTVAATGYWDQNPSICYDYEHNRYLACYECLGEPNGVWVQFITSTGALDGSRISLEQGGVTGGVPNAAYMPNVDEFLFCWQSGTDNSNFARRISYTGTILGDKFKTNSYVEGNGNFKPFPVANTATGEYLITWYNSYDNIYNRRYLVAPPVNKAQYISDTIPTTMLPNQTYNVTVTMKNTGTTTWSGDGVNAHKLGGVGDSDPFYTVNNPPRILLNPGETVSPGAQRTFSFTMTAPSTPATYTTDWRMVQEWIEWFGDTLTKQIQVLNLPAAPSVSSPANGAVLTTLTPTISWTGDAHDMYPVRVSQQNDPSTSINGWDSGQVVSSGSSAACGTLRNYSLYYVFVRLHNAAGWGEWSAAGRYFIVNTNTGLGTVYTGDALPSTCMWQVYDTGSYENGSGITSTIVSDGGSNVWKVYDNSSTNRCKEKYSNGMNISFDTGASIAARMKATGVSGTPTYCLGISNGNVGGMYLRLYSNEVRLVDINGSNRGSYSLDATQYHKYHLSVKNSTPGNNATAVWRVYVDGVQRITWTGAGTDNGFDGFYAGQAGTAATGTWWFDWIGARADGEFSPAQWDPIY